MSNENINKEVKDQCHRYIINMVMYNLSKLENIPMNSVYDGSDMTPVDKLKLKNIIAND